MITILRTSNPAAPKKRSQMLSEHQDDCKVICGGQSLLIIMRQGLVTPEYVIDIKGLDELNYIKFDEKEGLKIGATTTHRTIEKSAADEREVPGPRRDGREAGLHPGAELGHHRREPGPCGRSRRPGPRPYRDGRLREGRLGPRASASSPSTSSTRTSSRRLWSTTR